MRRLLVGAFLVPWVVGAAQAPAHDTTLLSFDDAGAWRAIPSDGVRLALRSDAGVAGSSLRFDFDYQGHAGYGIARRAFTLPTLPAHWAMTLRVRGVAPANTIELKFVDSSGLNVWWIRRVALPVTADWREIRFRPTDLSFAWGPLGGGPPRKIAAVEIAVTAAQGGAGWLALDELRLLPLASPVDDHVRPRIAATSSAKGTSADDAIPPNFNVPPVFTRASLPRGWRSEGDGPQRLTLDFTGPRELSGLILDWGSSDFAADYDVERSDDGISWTALANVRYGGGGRNFLHLPNVETRWLRLNLLRRVGHSGYALHALHVLPANAAPSRSSFLETVAAAEPPGIWPRGLTHQQSYWTVLGLPRDERDAIISEDGAVESYPGSFSIEPFVTANGTLHTWADAGITHALDAGWRPIPEVTRTWNDAALRITSFAAGTTGKSVVWIRYRLVALRPGKTLYALRAAMRPVQVNPPWQFLGVPGGAADIHDVAWTGNAFLINGKDEVVAVPDRAVSSMLPFYSGNIAEELRDGKFSMSPETSDSTGFASAALTWNFTMAQGDSTDVWVALPASPRQATDQPFGTGEQALADARRLWDAELGALNVEFPGSGASMSRTLRTALADVLINARGPAIQPGTRSYRRSWIRDGALTSAALMRLGHASEARAFLDWYIPYQFADGKVPCCVDLRGADPVPENDSDGELLYLAAEYVRMTRDTATAVRHWAQLRKAAAHLDSLRRTRRTALYQSAESLFVFGLVPPSISHEGYSAKPAYSYWDDWWAVQGMRDAAWLATVVGDVSGTRALSSSATELAGDVANSIKRSMAMHHMSVLPGAAELGDFDPTSSTIALEPAQGMTIVPPKVLYATFDSAWKNFTARRDGKEPWEVYTPYEWRQVGSLIRLGQPERAHALAAWFMDTRRPSEWNEWSEAVWRDPRAPKFVGDMPHGWVESDFIRATLDFVEYERAGDSTLVVGAGIPIAWARDAAGVAVRGVHTWWGVLDLRTTASGNRVTMEISGVTPPGALEVYAPFGARPVSATVNGVNRPLTDAGRGVRIAHPSAQMLTVVFAY